MGTIADAKFTHNYNCYNGHFIGCLPIFFPLMDIMMINNSNGCISN